jgi:hypothetical protein
LFWWSAKPLPPVRLGGNHTGHKGGSANHRGLEFEAIARVLATRCRARDPRPPFCCLSVYQGGRPSNAHLRAAELIACCVATRALPLTGRAPRLLATCGVQGRKRWSTSAWWHATPCSTDTVSTRVDTVFRCPRTDAQPNAWPQCPCSRPSSRVQSVKEWSAAGHQQQQNSGALQVRF